MHPAQRRAWLQTGGLPVEPIHADLREAIDAVDTAVYIGGACFKLFDPAGNQIGIVQMQGTPAQMLDAAVAATTERLALGKPKPIDIAAGDTLIRELDMNDPTDREMAGRAITGANPSIVIPDIERADPPPIDLPDYVAPENVPDYRAPEHDFDDRAVADAEGSGWPWIVLAYAVIAAVIAAGVFLIGKGH